MAKVVLVCGAGPGLGTAFARRFGKEGYTVALAARRLEPLQALTAELAKEGITAAPFQVDFTDESSVSALVAAVHAKFGQIDAVYYAPASNDCLSTATDLSVDFLKKCMGLWCYGLISVVRAVLPEMRERGEGALLVVFGGAAAEGRPYFSGSSPAEAASRNYLYSLRGELIGEGINIGMVTVAGVIKGSGFHQAMEAGYIEEIPGVVMPLIDPEDIADEFWQAATGKGQFEVAFPKA